MAVFDKHLAGKCIDHSHLECISKAEGTMTDHCINENKFIVCQLVEQHCLPSEVFGTQH